MIRIAGLSRDLGERGIDVDNAADFAQADAVAHRKDKLVNEIAGVSGDQRDPKNAVAAASGEDLHKAARFIFNNRTVEVGEL